MSEMDFSHKDQDFIANLFWPQMNLDLPCRDCRHLDTILEIKCGEYILRNECKIGRTVTDKIKAGKCSTFDYLLTEPYPTQNSGDILE